MFYRMSTKGGEGREGGREDGERRRGTSEGLRWREGGGRRGERRLESGCGERDSKIEGGKEGGRCRLKKGRDGRRE